MPRSKPWTWENHNKGYIEVRMTSWRHFSNFIYTEMLDFETYVWRGHRRSDWKLEPTLDRLARSAGKTHDLERFQERHIERFQYAARGRRGTNPPGLDNDSWWALGQHNGLATPLLDWTTSPFVAAFFAFVDVGKPQTRQRAVYAIHQPTIEKWAKRLARVTNKARQAERERREKEGALGLIRRALLRDATEEVRFIKPLSDENHRLMNQGGLFSRSPPNVTLEDWVLKNHDPSYDGYYTLIKILIPNRDREACLRNLNRMNINHLSLFPDLYGASKYCNLLSEIPKY